MGKQYASEDIRLKTDNYAHAPQDLFYRMTADQNMQEKGNKG